MSEPDLTNQCEICGNDNPKTFEEHHVVPQRYGGSDRSENIVNLCSNCHAAVERIWDDDFYRRLEQAKDGLDVNAVESDDAGYVIEGATTPDRKIPAESPHVRQIEVEPTTDRLDEILDDDENPNGRLVRILACGYCDRLFKPYQQAELATHLQRGHGVSNPYEGGDFYFNESLFISRDELEQSHSDENSVGVFGPQDRIELLEQVGTADPDEANRRIDVLCEWIDENEPNAVLGDSQ